MPWWQNTRICFAFACFFIRDINICWTVFKKLKIGGEEGLDVGEFTGTKARRPPVSRKKVCSYFYPLQLFRGCSNWLLWFFFFGFATIPVGFTQVFFFFFFLFLGGGLVLTGEWIIVNFWNNFWSSKRVRHNPYFSKLFSLTQTTLPCTAWWRCLYFILIS